MLFFAFTIGEGGGEEDAQQEKKSAVRRNRDFIFDSGFRIMRCSVAED